MRMKKIVFFTFGTVFLLLGTLQVNSQKKPTTKNIKTSKVQKYTIMEEFEPDLVLSVNERVQLKKEHFAKTQRMRGILDTIDISDRKRQRLLKELIRNPLSNKLNKAVAEIGFEEDEVEN